MIVVIAFIDLYFMHFIDKIGVKEVINNDKIQFRHLRCLHQKSNSISFPTVCASWEIAESLYSESQSFYQRFSSK